MRLNGLRAVCTVAPLIIPLVLVLSAQLSLAQPNPSRALNPNDLLKFEGLADVALAPDERRLAFTHCRSLASAVAHDPPVFGTGNCSGGSDIWVIELENGSSMNITSGESNGMSYWQPRWSPDGAQIAAFAVKGLEDALHLVVWNKTGERVKQLIEEPLVGPGFGNGCFYCVDGFSWVDNHHIVAILQPEGGLLADEGTAVGGRYGAVPMRAWLTKWKGKEATSSVLDSGGSSDLTRLPQRRLVLVDVDSGATQEVLRSTQFRDLQVSPGGRYISVFARQPGIEGGIRLARGGRILDASYRLILAAAQGSITQNDRNAVCEYLKGSFQWSPDGSRFAFIATTSRRSEPHLEVFQGTLGGALVALPHIDLDPDRVVWANKRTLLVLAKSGGHMNWWATSPSGQLHNITERFVSVPSMLQPDASEEAVLGVIDGDVWRLSIDSGIWTNITASSHHRFSDLVWPVRVRSVRDRVERLIASTDNGDYYSIDSSSKLIEPLLKPSEMSRLITYSSAVGAGVFLTADRRGTSLTLMRGGKSQVLIEINTFLREIAEGSTQKIEYRGLDGQTLKGWILLPPNYEAGKRYPLVTVVYPGDVMRDDPPDDFGLRYGHLLVNRQLLAARGYVVLEPSMPLPPEPADGGSASDPYMELIKGVLPAVDKVIDKGIADPKRLAIMGHSFGGFAVYGLVTQTNRFRAAIATAGISDFISHYGTFDGRARYWADADEVNVLSAAVGYETTWGRMGAPPWKDWSRYQRNSPLFYVDRVQTPLLIAQGDMDPISQGEEFFSALKRQGKRARFVRYWGEGHSVASSPANHLDFVAQVYAWLDEFCDISRDTNGNLVFDGNQVKSRAGAPPLQPAEFLRFK